VERVRQRRRPAVLGAQPRASRRCLRLNGRTRRGICPVLLRGRGWRQIAAAQRQVHDTFALCLCRAALGGSWAAGWFWFCGYLRLLPVVAFLLFSGLFLEGWFCSRGCSAAATFLAIASTLPTCSPCAHRFPAYSRGLARFSAAIIFVRCRCCWTTSLTCSAAERHEKAGNCVGNIWFRFVAINISSRCLAAGRWAFSGYLVACEGGAVIRQHHSLIGILVPSWDLQHLRWRMKRNWRRTAGGVVRYRALGDSCLKRIFSGVYLDDIILSCCLIRGWIVETAARAGSSVNAAG